MRASGNAAKWRWTVLGPEVPTDAESVAVVPLDIALMAAGLEGGQVVDARWLAAGGLQEFLRTGVVPEWARPPMDRSQLCPS